MPIRMCRLGIKILLLGLLKLGVFPMIHEDGIVSHVDVHAVHFGVE